MTARRRLSTLLLGTVLAFGLAAPALAQEDGESCADADEGVVVESEQGIELICTTTPLDSELRWRDLAELEDAFEDDAEAIEEELDDDTVADLEDAVEDGAEAVEEELDDDTIAELEDAVEDADVDEIAAPTEVAAGSGGLVANGTTPWLVLLFMTGGLLLASGGVIAWKKGL